MCEGSLIQYNGHVFAKHGLPICCSKRFYSGSVTEKHLWSFIQLLLGPWRWRLEKKLAPKVVNIGSRYLTMMMFCGKNHISYLISKGKSKFLELTYKIYDCSMLHYSCLSYPTPTTKRRCQHHMTDVPPLTATDRFCSFLMQRLLQSCSVGLHGPVLDRSPRRERRPWLLARG